MAPLTDRPRTIAEFLAARRPRVIAHRGLSGLAPENTLAAFRRAIEVRADMIELDVLASADGEVVVIHDATLERTTDGSGPVADRTLDELRQLDAGSWFAPEFRGERIPTLREVCEVCEVVRDDMLLNVEIKEEAVTDVAAGGIVERVIRTVRAAGAVDRVVLSSFDPRALAQARAIEPRIARASLFNEALHRGRRPDEIVDEVGASILSFGRDELTGDLVRRCHEHGRLAFVYTVDEIDEMRRMLALGVDGLFTNRPDRLLGMVGPPAAPP